MVFEVTEIKALGKSLTGYVTAPEGLSLRLESRGPISRERVFTLHAVVPYSPEFATVQVGQKFLFERIEKPLQKIDRITDLNRRLRSNDLTCDEAGCEGTLTAGMKHAEGCSLGYIKK